MHFAAVLASSLLALAPLAQDAPTIKKAPPSKAPVPAAETEAGPHAKLLAMLGPELEKADGTKVKTTDALEGRKNVLIYFTASWCGPCRRFTPDLVKYAN